MITKETVVSQSGDNVYSQIGNTALILNLADGSYYGLDPLGTMIWNRLSEPIRVAALIEAMMAEHDLERTACVHDVTSLLGDLYEMGLIEIRERQNV